jgi:predicted nucleotidyltransferase
MEAENSNGPLFVFEKQKQHLDNVSKKDLDKLFQLYNELKAKGYDRTFMRGETFNKLHTMLYELKLIFNFDWMEWKSKWKNINDTSFDFTQCNLVDLSKYLTAIFRADRFSDGTIEQNFRNGTLDKIFQSFIDKKALQL